MRTRHHMEAEEAANAHASQPLEYYEPDPSNGGAIAACHL